MQYYGSDMILLITLFIPQRCALCYNGHRDPGVMVKERMWLKVYHVRKDNLPLMMFMQQQCWCLVFTMVITVLA